MQRKYLVILASTWLVLFIGALIVDDSIAQWVHHSGLSRHVEGAAWAQVLKSPGNFTFTFVAAIVLGASKQIRWHQAVFVMLCAICSGLHVLLKWTVGRTRPYKLPGPGNPRPFELHPFRDGIYGFFHQTNLSFPSGHACIAAAVAAAMVVAWPRGSWIFVVLAVVVGGERIAENAHYCSDVIGAFGFGVLSVLAVRAILPGWATPADRKILATVS